ncbi:hypothetical protein CJJ18_02075 [Candidatus Williamhamiltonella defendens]|uniref:Uncharacterized protein n=1 Tax=Candidatus Williamhamiltonella defendens TaxID=138072 RepID=A0A4P2SKT2_9ENTR|nr:hypothetical protein [Candidatus Hamiltonella defensa]ASV33082.1 hypothetical protein CJJ18_02060 [Candidatus Hamiltonella defensa]ASV33085.1 hypothetical protein CJJ18_02075 [Candidatus Hamiltonella defensa]AWK16037.1 hypothetical protein CCS40_02075 [Candidatus Hamiltonella defensa]AWK16038.1 hypothetical protein CCS40_02090 [Candidatus Hamiltonella defensa]
MVIYDSNFGVKAFDNYSDFREFMNEYYDYLKSFEKNLSLNFIFINLGMQKGEKQASLKIAHQLLESGMDRQSVRQLTGLSETEMKSLFQDSP